MRRRSRGPAAVRITRTLGKALRRLLRAFVGAMLYGPVILLAIFSFNDSISVSLPLRGFTTKWYTQILGDEVMRTSIHNSLIVAIDRHADLPDARQRSRPSR